MKIVCLIGILLLPLKLTSQNNEKFNFSEGKFFAQPELYVLATQIDGDQASGYSKMGYHFGVSTGLGLSNNQSLSFQMALAERGSRRSFNPDEPTINAFHIRYTSLDIGLLYGKAIQSIYLQGGIKGTYLLNISETEGYVPQIENDYKKIGFLFETRLNYELSEHYWLSATLQYSILSLLNTNVSQVNYLMGGGGAFHNVLGVGLIWKP